MTKKLLIIVAILCISIFACTYVFADNNLNKAGEDIKNVVQDAGNAVRNGVQHVENGVEDGARNAGNAIQNGTKHVENGANDMGRGLNNDTQTGTTNNDGYTTARLANEGTGMNNAWTWIIIAVIAVVAIALIWYFVTRNNENK